MGSKIKGWHNRGPKKDTRRMSEDNSFGRSGKFKDRHERKPNESKRVDYTKFNDQF